MSYVENVRTVVPYVPGEQPKEKDMIKLNTNECPYPPAPGIKKALADFPYEDMRLYPNPEVKPLVKDLADYYGLEEDQVFVGVGSDDVLATAFLTFFNSEKPILFPDITYGFYDVWANVYRIPFETQALDDKFMMKKEDYMKPNGGIVIANPNAPTGLAVELSFIEEILRANPDVVVIVDEAYIDFGAKSALPLIQKYDNLCVVQTFSKSRALAGCRVGYAMGNKELIGYLNQVKFSINSYTINMPTLTIAPIAIKEDAYFKEITGKICDTRERMKVELKKLGFSFPDSMGNFIFATHEEVAAKDIFEDLMERKIYVRYFKKKKLDSYLRISVGTDQEIDRLLEALKEILEKRTK
jgi:histidinol-phosphate aminotransferase